MKKNRITEILGIKYPIIQGPMAWLTDAKLVAAVSNAGGLGILGPCAGQTTMTPSPQETMERMREEIRKTIIGNEEVFTGRPADKIAPEYDKLVEETRDFTRSEEDVLSYALFPQVAKDFLIKKYENE